MGVLEELEVDAQQRWMADVLVELVAIRKLLELLVGKQNLLTLDFEAKSEPGAAELLPQISPYEYDSAAENLTT